MDNSTLVTRVHFSLLFRTTVADCSDLSLPVLLLLSNCTEMHIEILILNLSFPFRQYWHDCFPHYTSKIVSDYWAPSFEQVSIHQAWISKKGSYIDNFGHFWLNKTEAILWCWIRFKIYSIRFDGFSCIELVVLVKIWVWILLDRFFAAIFKPFWINLLSKRSFCWRSVAFFRKRSFFGSHIFWIT